MYRKRIIAIILGAAVFLSACAQASAPAETSSTASTASAASEASHGEREGAPLKAEEIQISQKIVPGCRSTLAYPLKMQGESTATDFSKWTATDLDGQEVNQDSLKDSRLTLVNVWATFCGGHVEDLEILQRLYEAYPREDLNVVGILASSQLPDGSLNEDEVGYVKYLLDMTGANYPQILPSDDLIQIKLKDLNIIPESFLVDGQGNQVGESWIGSRSLEELEELVNQALATQPSP